MLPPFGFGFGFGFGVLPSHLLPLLPFFCFSISLFFSLAINSSTSSSASRIDSSDSERDGAESRISLHSEHRRPCVLPASHTLQVQGESRIRTWCQRRTETETETETETKTETEIERQNCYSGYGEIYLNLKTTITITHHKREN